MLIATAKPFFILKGKEHGCMDTRFLVCAVVVLVCEGIRDLLVVILQLSQGLLSFECII